MQKSTRAFSDRSPNIMKNVEESTDKLNRTMGDLREILGAVARGDGTIQRLLSDPTLYNNVNDTATMVNRMLPRLDRALRDLEIFADKLARHPSYSASAAPSAPAAASRRRIRSFPGSSHIDERPP